MGDAVDLQRVEALRASVREALPAVLQSRKRQLSSTGAPSSPASASTPASSPVPVPPLQELVANIRHWSTNAHQDVVAAALPHEAWPLVYCNDANFVQFSKTSPVLDYYKASVRLRAPNDEFTPRDAPCRCAQAMASRHTATQLSA